MSMAAAICRRPSHGIRWWLSTLATRAFAQRAYGNLGSAYRQMGESMKAKQCFETALQLTPDASDGMAMVGLGLIAQKQWRLCRGRSPILARHGGETDRRRVLLLAHALQQEGRHGRGERDFVSEWRAFHRIFRAAQEMAQSLLSGK
jgi:tetratricopeptide (TPR) repeat protein